MIYVVFWYLVSVIVLSNLCQFYKVVSVDDTNANKFGALIGTNIKFAAFLYFLYTVYPLLSLIK